MPLPAVVVGLGSFLLSQVGRAIGIAALRQAFVRGGLMGFGRALLVRVGTAIAAHFTISRLTNYAFNAIEYIWRFNWNISDEDINQQINAQLTSLAGVAGGAVGATIGGVSCTLGMAYINPEAFLWALEEIGEELYEEISSNFTNLLNLGIRAGATALFLNGYKSLRNWLKSSGIANSVLGVEKADAWGKSRNVVSFAKTWEDFVENIKPEWLRNFIEEAAEEAYEFCKEMTLFIATRFDQFLGLQRAGMREAVLGDQVMLEIYPNRQVDEYIVLQGREEIVRQQTTMLLSQHQLIRNRDIGVISVPDYASYTEQSIRRAPREISCKFEFVAYKEPPFYRPINTGDANVKNKVVRVQIDVGNISRSKLDWLTLKNAAGGSNGYMYGREKCVMYLTNSNNQNLGSITVWASNFGEAKDRCEAMRLLQNGTEIKNIDSGTEVEGGRRTTQKGNMKPIVKIYPYRVIITIGMDITDPTLGRQKLNSATGRQIQRKAIISLMGNSPPSDFDERINDLFALVTQG